MCSSVPYILRRHGWQETVLLSELYLWNMTPALATGERGVLWRGTRGLGGRVGVQATSEPSGIEGSFIF